LFITLEGGEGAGKSVQAQALSGRLREQGHAVTSVREPGGTLLGERLRELLLSAGDINPLAETLLFFAARDQLITEVIRPALERREIVICDRFTDSTRAYQGFGRGVSIELIDKLNAAAAAGVKPDLKVLLDLPVLDGLARARTNAGRDRFEQEEIAFHERVRQGYLSLAENDPGRWLVVDATMPADRVTRMICDRVEALLNESSA